MQIIIVKLSLYLLISTTSSSYSDQFIFDSVYLFAHFVLVCMCGEALYDSCVVYFLIKFSTKLAVSKVSLINYVL